MERRILEGVRVLDISQVLAGPLCGRHLADLGADVIRIDRPPRAGSSEPVRASGAPAVNLGKRSIAIDIGDPAGNAVARELALRADVVIENFRPGALARAGLGYKQLAEENPRLIYASISGFGQSGPESERRAFGYTAQAESGLLWLQQRALGSEAPFAPGVMLADIVTAMNASSAIMGALYDRERTGRGQHVDITLVESQLALFHEAAAAAFGGAIDEDWRPHRHEIFAAIDGHIAMDPSERLWSLVAEALGHPEAPWPGSRERFRETVAPWMAALTLDEAVSGLRAVGSPFGVVRSIPEALDTPYFAERGMIAELPDPLDGSVRAISSPLHFSDAAAGPTGPAPLAGEHTRQVLLEELGYTTDRIEELLAAGAVVHQEVPATSGVAAR